MSEQRPNFFELLDITPTELGDNEAEIKRFIQEKRINKWQRNKTAENVEKIKHKNAILQVMLDPALRRQEAEDFNRRRREAQRRLEDEVRRLINHAIKEDLTGRRYLLKEKFKQIADTETLNKRFSADDVRRLVPPNVEILDKPPVETAEEPGDFEPIKHQIPGIEENLKTLKINNLYQFLEQAITASTAALQQAAEKKYNEANYNPNKTLKVEATSTLAGICQTVFRDDVRRAAYDHYEVHRKYAPFRKKIDELAGVVKEGEKTVFTRSHVEDLHKKAAEIGLTRPEAEEELERYAGIKGYSIHIETTTVAPFKMKKGEARNPGELAALIDQNWAESKDYVSRPAFESWLDQAGEGPLSSEIGKIRRIHTDANIALELCVQALDSTLSKPAIKVTPPALDFGSLEEMQGKQQQFHIEHASGRGWVSGSIAASTNSWLKFSPDKFSFGPAGRQTVKVSVNSNGLGAGVKKQGDIFIEPESALGASALKVPVQMQVIFPWQQLAWRVALGAVVGLGIALTIAFLLDNIIGIAAEVGIGLGVLSGIGLVIGGMIIGGVRHDNIIGGAVAGGIGSVILYSVLSVIGSAIDAIQINAPTLYYILAGFAGLGLGAAAGNYKAFTRMNRIPMGVLFSSMAVITVFGVSGGGFTLGGIFSRATVTKQIEAVAGGSKQDTSEDTSGSNDEAKSIYPVNQKTTDTNGVEITLTTVEDLGNTIKLNFTVHNVTARAISWRSDEGNEEVYLISNGRITPEEMGGIFAEATKLKALALESGWMIFPKPPSNQFSFNYPNADQIRIELPEQYDASTSPSSSFYQVAYDVNQSTIHNDDFKLTLNTIEAEEHSLKFEFTVENIGNHSQNWKANKVPQAVFLLVETSGDKKLYPTKADGVFATDIAAFKSGQKLKGWFVFPRPGMDTFEFHYLQANPLNIDLAKLAPFATPQSSTAAGDSSSGDSLAVATSTRAPTRTQSSGNNPEIQALCTEIYVVQKGDWASKIAEAYLGDVEAFNQIIEATNQARQYDSSFVNLRDPNKLEVGDKLCIPVSESIEVSSSDNDQPQLFIKINDSEICGCSPQSGMTVYDFGSKAQFCFWSNTVTTAEASISFPNNSQPTYTFPVLEKLDSDQQCHNGPMPNHPAGVYTLKVVSLTTPDLEQTLRFKLDECRACK